MMFLPEHVKKPTLLYLGKTCLSWEVINLEKFSLKQEWLCTFPGLFACQSVTEGQKAPLRRSYPILVVLCL